MTSLLERHADEVTWTVCIDAADDIGALANFAHRHVGRELTVEVPPDKAAGAQKDDRIAARVTYEGAPGGGSFLLLELDSK